MFSAKNQKLAFANSQFVNETVAELLRNRCVQIVTQKPHICSPLSVVSKILRHSAWCATYTPIRISYNTISKMYKIISGKATLNDYQDPVLKYGKPMQLGLKPHCIFFA